MSDSQTNFTLTDPAIEPIDLNRMDEFLFSAMLRASIHLGGSHAPLQLSRMVRKSLLKLSLEKDLTFDLAYAKEFTPVSKLSPWRSRSTKCLSPTPSRSSGTAAAPLPSQRRYRKRPPEPRSLK